VLKHLSAPSAAVVDRKQHVRFYPSSASSLSLTGTKTFRIRIGGEDFIDPSSIRLQYTIQADDGLKSVQPLTGPWGCWSQIYRRSNGTELDNIPNYNRFHQQFGWNHLTRAEQFGSVGVEGFHMGAQTTNNDFKPKVGLFVTPVTVMHRLHLSLLNSGKLLPVKYAPLEIELSMVNDLNDFLQAASVGGNGAQSFVISDVQILMDCYVLDEAILQSFYNSLLRNQVLSIPLLNCYQICHPIPAGATTYSFSSVRAFSRLSHVWLTFRGTGAKSAEFICPTTIGGSGATPALADGAPSARLSIGPKYWPDPAPSASIPELFYQFQKALPGVPNITRDTFLQDAFTIVFDVRKMPSDPTSSISMRSGDLLRVDLLNLTANRATECWLTLFAFSVTAVRESGVTLLT
jgi:hypothetical protein